MATDWYADEERTRDVLVSEFRRIAIRTRARPIRVLVLAAALTTLVWFKLSHRAKLYEANVVLAMTETSLAPERTGIPYDELKQYVQSVLLPDSKLAEVIDRRNLFGLRRRLGEQYAINELRDQLEIEIWKNSFVYYTEEEDNALKSARISITVANEDPEQSAGIAHDLATLAIQTHEERRLRSGQRLATQLELMRDTISLRLGDLDGTIARQQAAIDDANDAGQRGRVAGLMADMSTLVHERKESQTLFSKIVASPDAMADKVAESGLGITMEIVDERHPDRHERSGFATLLELVVIGSGCLLGACLLLGAFDSRIHDADDLARIGLPLLGQLPRFAGDGVASLRARGGLGTPRVRRLLPWRSRR